MIVTLERMVRRAPGRLAFFNFIALIVIRVLVPHGSAGLATITEPLRSVDEESIVRETNQSRSLATVPLLQRNTLLDGAARAKLDDMERGDYFAHVTPEGRQPWDFIGDLGYRYRAAGENLAQGYSDARAVVGAWMQSESHRANITNGTYTDIGIAARYLTIAGRSDWVIVQMFAAPSLQSAAVHETPTAVHAQRTEQAVTTEHSVPKVAAPIPTQVPTETVTAVVSRGMGSALSLYLGVLLVGLGAVAFRRGIRKPVLAELVAHTALFILSLVLPFLQTVSGAVVF